jgi:Domain of unknown function (DUF4349)
MNKIREGTHMSIRNWLLATSLVALAACGAPNAAITESEAPRAAMKMDESADFASVTMAEPAPPPMKPDVPTGDPAAITEQYIAYSHSVGLRLPFATIEPTLTAHTAACKTAGPSVCIVINSNLNTYSEDQTGANLQLKAKPEWIDTFLGGLEAQAAAAKGEISSRNTSAEDLTVSIIDTDARLKAQIVLQGRLEKLLADRPGKLGELLETERELARVNSEVDSLKSILAAMRQRVSMSDLSLNYETKVNPVSAGALAPISGAFENFFYNLSSALAAVVTAFAIGLPWLLLIGFFLWIWLKLIWPRVRRKKPAA